jgi:hypothetical protein
MGDACPSGTVRVTKKFRVEELSEYAWLKLLKGEKQGLQFAVEYGGFRDELSEGEVVDATVESLNERNTAWKLVGVEKCSKRRGGFDG